MEPVRGYVSESAVRDLIELSKELKFTFSLDHYVRLGEHENERISEYYVSKWHYWNRHQRKRFKSHFPEDMIGRQFLGNFTRHAAKTGFLDRIVQFRDRNQKTGIITAVALFDNQEILINDVSYILNAGDAIIFSVRCTHEVPLADHERLWCVLCET